MTSLRRSIAASVLFTLFGGPGLVLVYLPWLITRFRVPSQQPLAQTTVAVLFMLRQEFIRSCNLAFPTSNEICWNRQRAVGLAIASPMHVLLPMSPSVVFDRS